MRRFPLVWFVLSFIAYSQQAISAEPPTIKIGILHSLSGTMAQSETVLKDVMLMLIAQQNSKGGVLGRKLEPVILDPASDWPKFAHYAEQLIEEEDVAVIFGGWTSVSRKSMLPVLERNNSLLFYPVQYEGQESSKNIFYTGAAPNQQAIPAIDFLTREKEIDRWILVGTDYVYPRTVNEIISNYLQSQGVKKSAIRSIYKPFGSDDWLSLASQVKRRSQEGEKIALISTINGDSNTHFFEALDRYQLSAEDITVLSFSIGEQEIASMGNIESQEGYLTVWNYFMSAESESNAQFITAWQQYIQQQDSVTNDPMEAHYIGFNMWVNAVEKAGTVASSKVQEAIIGVSVPNLTGGYSTMMPNHHITKPILVGQLGRDGQFEIVWKSSGLVAGDAWSDYLENSKNLISDWRKPFECGRFDVVVMRCLNQEY